MRRIVLPQRMQGMEGHIRETGLAGHVGVPGDSHCSAGIGFTVDGDVLAARAQRQPLPAPWPQARSGIPAWHWWRRREASLWSIDLETPVWRDKQCRRA